MKFAVELGLSIMLDKPLIAIVRPGVPVPERLARVADLVVEADLRTPEGQAAIQEAVERIGNDIKGSAE